MDIWWKLIAFLIFIFILVCRFFILQISNFIQIWKESSQEHVRFEEFGKIYPNVPKQKPGYATLCYVTNQILSGPFFFVKRTNFCYSILCSLYLQIWLWHFHNEVHGIFDPRNVMQCSFSNTDVPSFRIRYAHDMVMMDHNSEHDAKFLVCRK